MISGLRTGNNIDNEALLAKRTTRETR